MVVVVIIAAIKGVRALVLEFPLLGCLGLLFELVTAGAWLMGLLLDETRCCHFL